MINVIRPKLAQSVAERVVNIKKLIRYKWLLMLYKAIHGLYPDYISVLATPYVPQRHLRSANTNLLLVQKTHVHYDDTTFTVSATKMWNQLSTVILKA